ncbi:hypothetical protein BASA81_006092 [Batrachochytrium salamandrivorans]|nr:hypothetical protein BASA81_006092 [Batrachochytrium salamandrivorans]
MSASVSGLQSEFTDRSPGLCSPCFHWMGFRKSVDQQPPVPAPAPAPAAARAIHVETISPRSVPASTIHKNAVSTVYDLPPGWTPVPSRSRPDRVAYLNDFTGERISWLPTEPASTCKGEIRRSKKKSASRAGSFVIHTGESGSGGGAGGGLASPTTSTQGLGDRESRYSSESDRTATKLDSTALSSFDLTTSSMRQLVND